VRSKQHRTQLGLLLHDPKGIKNIMGTAKTACIASSKSKAGSWGGWASGTLHQKVREGEVAKVPGARKVQGPVKGPTPSVSVSFGACMSGVRDLLVDEIGLKQVQDVGKTTAPKAGENFPFDAIENVQLDP
jgi:hypothetical protein